MTLRNFTDDGQIVLPIGGTTYTVPPVSARLTLEFIEYENAADQEATRLGQMSEIDLYKELLGDVWDRMIEDGRTIRELRMAGLYTYIHTTRGDEAAALYWDTEGKVPAPNRAAKRATKTRSRSTAGARKTP